jgi:tRNA(Arg) A34 adenosine deaminase TadA
MVLLTILLALTGLTNLVRGHQYHANHIGARSASQQTPLAGSTLAINGIPFSTRAYWMRQANLALPTPCPFGAFGTVIVNHTANDGLGELVCTGANNISATGNPTLHGNFLSSLSQTWRLFTSICRLHIWASANTHAGEIAAINNCTTLLTSPTGPYNLTPSAAQAAFSSLSLYTNAESCPMCASAIRWAGFKEYIYGTSIDRLIELGWGQIRISSAEVFRESYDLGSYGRLMGEVLTNETDGYFSWQYDPEGECPRGCARGEGGCEVV